MEESSSILSPEKAQNLVQSVYDYLDKKIFGQSELIEEALATLLSSGHILMTGAPGLAKTTLVREIANSIGLEFGRIQFTPDLMPSDIVGSEILDIDEDSGKRKFQFQKGPIFTNLLLADEINRASPRTQAALLEAMQEKTVTNSGHAYQLAHTFMVFATQNPLDNEGTFPLPEAQLDRFLLSSFVDYPKASDELEILNAFNSSKLVGESKSETREVLSYVDLVGLIEAAKNVRVENTLLSAINDLVRSTRPSDQNCPELLREAIDYGSSPRGGLAIVSAAKSFALMDGSTEVRWRHIKRVATAALRHRVKISFGAQRDGMDIDQVIFKLIENIEKKTVKLGQLF